jgi:hypothetical protein
MLRAFPILAMLLATEAVLAIECQGRHHNRDALALEITRDCGQPFWRQQQQLELPVQRDGDQTLYQTRWLESRYYNFGPSRLMRRLDFVEGVLVRELTMGYGIDQDQIGQRCEPGLLREGMSQAEVYLRCGKPGGVETRYGRNRVTRQGEDIFLGSVEYSTWIVSFGRGRMDRILSFENGALVQVATGQRR